MEQMIPATSDNGGSTPKEENSTEEVGGQQTKKKEKRLKILSLSAVTNNVNRGSLTPYNLRPSETLKRRLSAGSLKNACKSTPSRKSVLRRKLRMSNLTKIMNESNQEQDLEENVNNNADEPSEEEDFKENSNNNTEQLTFKEFEADVMDSSLIHDTSYNRVQSSQEDEAFVSAVEEFTDGLADVTLTGAADFGNSVSHDDDDDDSKDTDQVVNLGQRETTVSEPVSTAVTMNETFIKTDETQANAKEAEKIQDTATPTAKTQHPPKAIAASVNYCLTPENSIQPIDSDSSKENPKMTTAKSARKSVHFSAIVSKIPRSSLSRQSTRANIRKSLAFLPHSTAAAAMQPGYNPRKSTAPSSRTTLRSSMMPVKPSAMKKQSFPRGSLAPKRSSIAVGSKKSMNVSAKRESNLKRLEHLLQPTSTVKRYQRHTISSASKVRPNHLTPSNPQGEDTIQAPATNNVNRRTTLLGSKKTARPSEKIPFRLF